MIRQKTISLKAAILKKREARKLISQQKNQKLERDPSFATQQSSKQGFNLLLPQSGLKQTLKGKKLLRGSLTLPSKPKTQLKTPLRKESESFTLEEDKTSTRAETPRDNPLSGRKRYFRAEMDSKVIFEDPEYWLSCTQDPKPRDRFGKARFEAGPLSFTLDPPTGI